MLILLRGERQETENCNFGYYWRKQSDHFRLMELFAKTFAQASDLASDDRTEQLVASIGANVRHQLVRFIDEVEGGE